MADGFFAVDEDWRVTYVNDRGPELLAEAMGADGGARFEFTGVTGAR